MYNQYKDKVEFFLVYIREAHPDSILYTNVGDSKLLKKITQTDNLKERKENAEMCTKTLNLSIPTLVDLDDNKVNHTYAGWPDRMYIIDTKGMIAYQGGPGPRGFKVGEVVQWLKMNVR